MPTSSTGRTSATRRCSSESPPRLGADATRSPAFLDSDAGVGEVAAALREAHADGITAVPTYVVDGAWAIPGAQDPDVFVDVIRKLAERRACRLTRSPPTATAGPAARPRPRVHPDRPVVAAAAARPDATARGGRGRRARSRRLRSRHGRSLAGAALLARTAAGRPTSVTRWVAASPCTLPSSTRARRATGADRCDAGHRGRRRAGRPACRRRGTGRPIWRIGLEAFLDEWLAQPLFAGLDREQPTSPTGSATGRRARRQPAPRRHRNAAAAVGRTGSPAPSCSSASRTPSSVRSPSGWPARSPIRR